MKSLIAIVIAVTTACGGDDGGGADAPVGDTPLRVTWELVGTDGPTRRAAPYVAAWNGALVLFGGQRGYTTFLDDMWTWDGTTWTELAPATRPFARANGRLLDQGDRLILTGGVGRDPVDDIGVLGETWAFDGSTWARLDGADIPARQSFGGARLGDRVMIYGGATTGGYFDDGRTLARDGAAWIDTPVGPAGRRAPTLTALGDRVYLYGGSEPALPAEVHVFDGTAWSVAGTMPGGGRAYHSAATLAGRLVVFGGVITSTDPIAATDAWPGGVEVVGDEPPTGGEMVTLGDAIYMWRSPAFDPNAPELTGELWRLRVAD